MRARRHPRRGRPCARRPGRAGRRRVRRTRGSERFSPRHCGVRPARSSCRPMTTTPGSPNGVVDRAGRSDARLALSTVAAAVLGFAVLVVLPYAVDDFARARGPGRAVEPWRAAWLWSSPRPPPASRGSRAVSPCGVAVTSMTRRDDCTWSCSSPWPRSPCSSPPTPGSRPSAGGRTEDPLSTGPVHDHVEIGLLLWTFGAVLWRTLWDRKNVGTSLPRTPCAGCRGPRRTLPTNSPLAEGWGSDGSEDPDGEATRRVGPVTGAAGSETGSVDRASHTDQNRGAPDAHTIWSPSPYFDAVASGSMLTTAHPRWTTPAG